ncbi:MAG TPA: alpha-E domain-containing protein [Candidatus Methylacidiphilales bacterium]|nr:alpha-E domain-containing protein [Candidatus Methylacidiphilales bacterium]
MLSRVADSLYWMSRYAERTENIARILDVNLQFMLDLPKLGPEEQKTLWEPVLHSTGDHVDFYQYYKEANSDTVIEFLTLNPKNPSAIINCLTAARENARHVREQISLEMWEEINRIYLWIKSQTLKKIIRQGAYEFFSQVKNASHLFQGITDGTMTHGEDWDFIQVGKYLERADMTTRILDANDEIFITQPAVSQTAGTLQWSAILRSCSSHDAYRKFYVAQVEPDKVVEFLILNEFFPRSIRFCVQSLNDALRRISGCKEEHFTNLAEKLSGRLVAELNYSALEDIKTVGMHKYMDELQIKLNSISNAIFQTYLFSPPIPIPEPEPKPAPEKMPSQSQKQTKTAVTA